MFVVHALVLTFITTPLTLVFYPPKHRTTAAPLDGPVTGGDDHEKRGTSEPSSDSSDGEEKTKFAIVLEKIEELPAAMTLSQLLPSGSPNPIRIDALRLMELTNRTSAVFRSTGADALIYNDPVVSVYRAFGQLNQLAISGALSIVGHEEFADAIHEHVTNSQSQMLLLPWSRGTTSILPDDTASPSRQVRNPFDGVFHKTTTHDQTSSVVHSEFIRQVFLRSPCDVGLFVERGTAVSSRNSTQHIFLPFFGGPDDRLALSFLVQICANSSVTATVVQVIKIEESLSPMTSNENELTKAALGQSGTAHVCPTELLL